MSAAALSPNGAVAWLRSLSIDVRGVAVLDASGVLLAGDPVVAKLATEAFAAAPGATRDLYHGDLSAVRTDRHTVAAGLGPWAMPRLVRCDLRAAAEALRGG